MLLYSSRRSCVCSAAVVGQWCVSVLKVQLLCKDSPVRTAQVYIKKGLEVTSDSLNEHISSWSQPNTDHVMA